MENWRNNAFLRLMVRNLPLDVTTLQVYENFKKYGTVVRITIFETRTCFQATRAEVIFEPPPSYPFWQFNVVFESSALQIRYVSLEIARDQRSKFTIDSPVREGVVYNEKTELLGDSLDFGVLESHNTMLIFASRGNQHNPPKLKLDLRRREIEISFPSFFKSDTTRATRSYRFLVAMDDDFSIWRVDNEAYVLHLKHPPWYSKQLKERMLQTHSVSGKSWSIEDTWARQTDIFGHKSDMNMIDNSPISLHKNDNTINIARWTTFRFNLGTNQDNKVASTIFYNILRDFNITTRDGASFVFKADSSKRKEHCWNQMNEPTSLDILEVNGQPSRAHLPFKVRYQLEVCLSHGWLSEYTITDDFLKRLVEWGEEKATQALIHVDSFQARVFDPMDLFREVRYSKPVRPKSLPKDCVAVYSATVTATSIVFDTATVELTNRIVRRYKNLAHRFLRVRFEDDNYRGQTRLFPASNNKMVLIFRRVKRTLRYGIRVGDMQYDFLAWGNSQLREHGAYFFAGTGDISADSIRAEMGDFKHEMIVAKRAARMGQCFSTTKPVIINLPFSSKVTTIPDIKHGKYIFSDGVGKISEMAARLIGEELRVKNGPPSVFQFRLGGCKGILAIAPELRGIDLKLRDSQFKFSSSYTGLEIIRWSQFWQPYLNRQLILCLSSLGVPDHVFLQKQETAINALDMALVDDAAAVKALHENVDPNMMTTSLCTLVEAGFRRSNEPFVSTVLQLWRSWALKYLKEKAKIPITQGAFVLGTMDETGSLQGHEDATDGSTSRDHSRIISKWTSLPEIFIQITDSQTGSKTVIEGICVLARNPSLHRGDIRVVMARNVPALHHMCDVVVMPQNGDRDLPSMCSGGDLDGDDYIVLWDTKMIPPVWNVEAFNYEPPPAKIVSDEITTNDMIDFFYDYMQNDYLGRIAHAHLAAADFFEDGLESSQCLRLAHLHSLAVDYPKTGVPARMERDLERNQWPHFMEKKGKSYRSHKILGKLYDAVERVKFRPKYDLPFDTRILQACRPSQHIFEGVQQLKRDYDNDLQRILAQHNIKTEFELWSTFVLGHSKASRDYKFHEEVGQLSSALKAQYYEALCEVAGGKDFEHLAPVAVAAYSYCHYQVELTKKDMKTTEMDHVSERMPFISFPWILQDVLIQIAKQADGRNAKPESTAVICNGNVIQQTSQIQVDQDGIASVEVNALNDPEVWINGHMHDPYIPHQLEQPGVGMEKSSGRMLPNDLEANFRSGCDSHLHAPVANGASVARKSLECIKTPRKSQSTLLKQTYPTKLPNGHLMVDPLNKNEGMEEENSMDFVPDQIFD